MPNRGTCVAAPNLAGEWGDAADPQARASAIYLAAAAEGWVLAAFRLEADGRPRGWTARLAANDQGELCGTATGALAGAGLRLRVGDDGRSLAGFAVSPGVAPVPLGFELLRSDRAAAPATAAADLDGRWQEVIDAAPDTAEVLICAAADGWLMVAALVDAEGALSHWSARLYPEGGNRFAGRLRRSVASRDAADADLRLVLEDDRLVGFVTTDDGAPRQALFRRASAVAPKSIDLRLGGLYLSQDLNADAADAYRAAIEALPSRERRTAWWGLGTALMRGGERRAAAEAFGRGLAETPCSISLAVEYVAALNESLPEAAAATLAAHPAIAVNAVLAYALSNVRLAAGDLAAALAGRERALRLPLDGRDFTVRPFRRAALFRVPADDPAARVRAWDIAARVGATVRREGYAPPFGRKEADRALLAEIPDGLFLGGETWVADAAGRLYVDLHFDVPGQHMPFYLHADGPGDAVPVILPEPVASVDGAAIALGGSVNYYHWIADFLPRLVAVLADPDLDGLPILINAARAPFQEWWLHRLGVDPARLVPVPYPGAVRCRRLIVPVLPFWERVAMMERFRGAPGGGGRRLFVVRRGGHRRMHGAAEVAEMLRGRGFVEIDPGGLAPEAQSALFAEAACVVGPHGAGLVNAIFAPPEAPLAEIINPAWRQPFFHNLAAAAGRPYAVADGTPREDDARLPLFWDMEARAATRAELAAALDALGL